MAAAGEDDPNVLPDDTPVTFGMLTEALANLNRGLSASLTQSLTTALNSRIDSAIAPAVADAIAPAVAKAKEEISSELVKKIADQFESGLQGGPEEVITGLLSPTLRTMKEDAEKAQNEAAAEIRTIDSKIETAIATKLDAITKRLDDLTETSAPLTPGSGALVPRQMHTPGQLEHKRVIKQYIPS